MPGPVRARPPASAGCGTRATTPPVGTTSSSRSAPGWGSDSRAALEGSGDAKKDVVTECLDMYDRRCPCQCPRRRPDSNARKERQFQRSGQSHQEPWEAENGIADGVRRPCLEARWRRLTCPFTADREEL